MDGTGIQAKIFYGLGKAASRLGFPFTIYRSASLINPIVPGNVIADPVMAAFVPTPYTYLKYNKPAVPDWTAIINATTLLAGDWIINAQATYYLAQIQPNLPLPAISCNRIVSINRAGYTTSAPFEPTKTLVAQALPVFMHNKKDREATPRDFPVQSDSKSGTPNWEFYINTRGVSDIRKNDVVTDENGFNYVIDVADLTDFGYICIGHDEKP